MVWGIAEDQIAFVSDERKAMLNIVFQNVYSGWFNIIRDTSASHRFADVKSRSSSRHRVDDQGVWLGEVMERMGDN